MKRKLNIQVSAQPDDVTCGPTCLHAIYNYYNDPLPLKKIIDEMGMLDDGGTLAVFLGCHALKRGYAATIYTYNLQMFDPTWFSSKEINIIDKLKEQAKHKKSKKLIQATKGYVEYLSLGGKVKYEELSSNLLRKYLNKSVPVLTGLSSTYLYNSSREIQDLCADDNVRGEPSGHFVILKGYDRYDKTVHIADPYTKNPISKTNSYKSSLNRVIGAILLGIVTYDANLLIIEKKNAK